MALPVGTPAPRFKLAHKPGEEVDVGAHIGREKVVLLFFPLAFSSVCTEEMCAFTDDFDAFSSKEVTVLPISVDSVPTLKEFKAKHGMKVDLGSDFKREVATAYGVLHPAFFSTRAYFLIDKTGVIRWSFVEATPGTRRQNAEILGEIAKLAG